MELERRDLGLAHVCSVEHERQEASLSEGVSTCSVGLERRDFAKLNGLAHVVWNFKDMKLH